MKFEEGFFEEFKSDIETLLKDIGNIQKISDIKKYLDLYFKYLYSLELIEKGKAVNDVKNDLWDDIVDRKKKSLKPINENLELGLATRIINDIFDNNRNYVPLKNLLNALIALITFQNKKGILHEMSHNPASYIASLLNDILPHDIFENNTTADLYSILSNHLNAIDKDIWDKLNRRPKTEVTFHYWRNIDNNLNTSFDNPFTISELIKLFNETETTYIIDASNSEIIGYDDYRKDIDNCLRNRYNKPDLFLLDSIMLPEYLEKGIITGTNAFLSEENERILNNLSSQDVELAKTINGTMEAIPLTRNFHVVSYSKRLGIDFKDETDKKIYDILIDDSKPLRISDCIDDLKNHIYSKVYQDSIFNFKDFSFSINDLQDNRLVVPMQLAKGAHAAYTFFAYFSNTFQTEDTSKKREFVHIEKRKANESGPEQTHCYLPNIYTAIKSFESFFKLIFNYVPIASLILDHSYSAVYREIIKNRWFDPCFPIEALKFHSNDNIIIKETNESKEDSEPSTCQNIFDKKMSCIGGYVIGLSKESKQTFASVNFAIDLAQKYLDTPISQIGKDTITKNDFINRIDYNNKQDLYNENKIYKTPEKIAKRPSVSVWKEIETDISDLIRTFGFVIFIVRIFIIINHSKKYSLYMKEDRFSRVIKEIENNLDDILNNFKEKITKFYSDTDSETSSSGALISWIDYNLNDIKAKKYTIIGLLNKIENIEHDEQFNPNIEQLFRLYAKDASYSLYQKISNMCYSNGWVKEFNIP